MVAGIIALIEFIDQRAKRIEGLAIDVEPVYGSFWNQKRRFARLSKNEPTVWGLHRCTFPDPSYSLEYGIVFPCLVFTGLKNTAIFFQFVHGFVAYNHALIALIDVT